MILWQANLGRGVEDAEFTRNVEQLQHAAGPRAVIALQEIDEADQPEEAEIVAWIFRRSHEIVGSETAVPILVPHHLPIVGRRVTHACEGLAPITPHRVVNEATLRIGRRLVGVLNTHLPRDTPETKSRRRDVRRTLRHRAREHDRGVWVADTNTRTGWPTVVRGEISVVDAGIDLAKAWAPDPIEVTDRWNLDLTIDGHNAHGARIRF